MVQNGIGNNPDSEMYPIRKFIFSYGVLVETAINHRCFESCVAAPSDGNAAARETKLIDKTINHRQHTHQHALVNFYLTFSA